MREFKFIPKECADHTVKKDGEPDSVVPKSFEGHIMLKVPTTPERYEYLENVGVTVNEDGQSVDVTSKIQRAKKTIEISEKFYLVVQLKKLDGDIEYKSFEDLSYDPDCVPILNDVASLLMEGIRPSKN